MNLVDIIFLAVALSIDAGIVSFSQGIIFVENKRKNSLKLALSVGFFQAFMPVIGWFVAKWIYRYVEAFSTWIAFSIFLALGIKFIIDAFKEDEKEIQKVTTQLSLSFLLFVSIATSIDALGAGVNLYFLKAPILISAIIIGTITFFNSLFSFWVGYAIKHFPSKYMEIAAGLILILLGVKVLF